MSTSHPITAVSPWTSWETTRLSGGLPVVLQHRHGPQILAARLAIRGGSSADPAGSRGAHQLLAGLMTRGCGDLDADALADLVEGAGAALRAEAHEDALVVGLKCAADDAPSLLPLLLAMVRRPTLATDQLELERRLNLQTLLRQKEDPFQLAHDGLRELLYGKGPYGHDPLGVEADLEGITHRDLLPLVENLGTQGAVLVLCGDPPEGVIELLEDSQGEPPWHTAMPTATTHTSAPLQCDAGRLARLEQETEQLVILLGATTVPLGHPDALPLRLLQAHLGLGMSCRLFVTMREERGLAYDVGVHLPARCGPAPFVMHLSTSVDRAEEAITALMDEWQGTLERSLQEDELLLALAKFQGQDAMGRQTGSQIAERQALVLSHGLPPDHVERQLERAERLTAADLIGAANRWLPNPCVSLVGPATALDAAERGWRNHPLSRQGSLV
jgi:predicted Zn-dependent peptidase